MATENVFTTQNAKTSKGEPLGWVTLIRYLAPGNTSGFETCPNRGACAATCLFTAGRGAFDQVARARVAKTWWRMTDKTGHLARAREEIVSARVKARKTGMRLAVRLNGTSDLPGDALELATAFPDVQFYDYTKLPQTILRARQNLHYTLSFDPLTVPWSACEQALARRTNVAVVFNTPKGEALPKSYQGFEVIDGDLHDLRFLDKRGVVVGLRAKGEAKQDTSGFVIAVK